PGFQFSHWTSSGGGTFSSAGDPTTVFVMAGEDTVVTAHFKRAEETSPRLYRFLFFR
ncbi:MAG: hypothetical protein LBR72_06255, partial [Oscillospiraceae bacterium]|nr:hypothetical protein [Oscillospiraceae bacterium]